MSVLKKHFQISILFCFVLNKAYSQVLDTVLYDNGRIKYIETFNNNSSNLNVFYDEEGQNLLKENTSFIFNHYEKKMNSNLTIIVQEGSVKAEYWVMNKDTIYNRVPNNKEAEQQERAILNYVRKKIKYPKEAVEKEIQGNVILSFIVNEEGEITNLKPLTQIGFGLEEEAMKKMAGYKNFGITKFNDKAVKLYIELPISFQM